MNRMILIIIVDTHIDYSISVHFSSFFYYDVIKLDFFYIYINLNMNMNMNTINKEFYQKFQFDISFF